MDITFKESSIQKSNNHIRIAGKSIKKSVTIWRIEVELAKELGTRFETLVIKEECRERTRE